MAQFAGHPKKIGIITSGGDAPGMNAGLRAFVRKAIRKDIEVIGFIAGYQGILSNQYLQLNIRSMGNILQRGGTILKAGRCQDFLKVESRTLAVSNLKALGIEALGVIGGDGSFRGALALWQEHQFPVIGMPGTIDNDIYGTETTIGFDTAVNTALSAIDKIRDTADAHDRLFIVEVMGRNSGHIAAAVGLAGGAEEIFTPEIGASVDAVAKRIKESQKKGKRSNILITAEGQKPGRAYDLADALRKKLNTEAKVCILGHQQRGGSPTASDRILAAQLCAEAFDVIYSGVCNVMIGKLSGRITQTSLDESSSKTNNLNKDLLMLALDLA
jgi:6-phosphofructokinase 1